MNSWRDPPNVLDAESTGDHVVDFHDGRVFADAKTTVDEQTKERLRLGRMCFNCYEPFERPFPDQCICGYPVGLRQRHDFAEKYAGDEGELGPTVKASDEIARMEEHLEYEQRTGIALPDSVKFPNPKVD